MHIALWSPAWPLEKNQNGIVTYVHWMKRGFEEQGHRVSIFTERCHPAVRDVGVYQVDRTPPSLLRRIVRRLDRAHFSDMHIVGEFASDIAASMLRVHREHPIDVIEIEESFGWFADIASQTRIPLAVKLHGPAFLSLVESELNTPFGREKIAAEGVALRRAETILSPSRSTLDQTITRYGLHPQSAHYIVNPVVMNDDTPLWSLDSCDRNTILFVGRFDLRKGADVVLRAFRLMLRDRPALKLIFVGPDRGWIGEDGTHVRFAAYRDLLFPGELRDRVDYRGPLPNREVAILRTQAMATVVASRWENLGYTLLEAMYQGCPVVCTDAGGCPETVVDSITGRLARSAVAEDFSRQLLAVMADGDAAASMGLEARKQVLDQYSLAQVVASSISVYESLTARSIR
jgi:glycosyltransferase involved in cell wall biosynthesis